MKSSRPENESRIRWRRLSISREGFSFLFVLMFILIGALVRQVNLLFVLAGLLIAALIVNWRYAMASIRKVRVRRKSPLLVHAGQLVTIDYEASNSHHWLTCWSLLIIDRIRIDFDPQCESQKSGLCERKQKRSWFRTGRRKAITNIQRLAPNDSGAASCRYQIERRGEYEMGPLNIATRFPLGLIRVHCNLQQHAPLLVAPRLGRITHAWATKLLGVVGEGVQASRHQSPHATGDFYSIRTWRSGDSRRAIDWRSTAKTGDLEVRQFEDQRHYQLMMVLDFWQPANASAQQIAGSELAASVFATVVDYVSNQDCGETFLALAGTELLQHKGRLTQNRRHEIMSSLATLVPAPDVGIESALDAFQSLIDSRCRVVVFSTREQQTLPQGGEMDIEWVDVTTSEFGQWFRV